MTSLTAEGIDLHGLDDLAAAFVERIDAPLTIGLVGTLGAGKTSFVQALARTMGIDDADVTSPTFTLLQSHQGSDHQRGRTLHHLDAYRLTDRDEFLELGVEELFEDPEAWTLVEWADRVDDAMPDDTLWIRINIRSPHERDFTFETHHPETKQLVQEVVAQWMSSTSHNRASSDPT